MKKVIALLAGVALVLGFAGCNKKAQKAAGTDAASDDLVAAAKAEGELTVYGSCE